MEEIKIKSDYGNKSQIISEGNHPSKAQKERKADKIKIALSPLL